MGPLPVESQDPLVTSIHIGIVGARLRKSLADRRFVHRLVRSLHDFYKEKGMNMVVVSGGCRIGPDRYAEDAAIMYGIDKIIHPVDCPGQCSKGEFTRRAYERNGLVARDSDILIALVSPERTGGTEDTIRKALVLGKEVRLVHPDFRVEIAPVLH